MLTYFVYLFRIMLSRLMKVYINYGANKWRFILCYTGSVLSRINILCYIIEIFRNKKKFPLKTRFRVIEGPVKTGFTVYINPWIVDSVSQNILNKYIFK